MDFDELESAEATSWEARWALRTASRPEGASKTVARRRTASPDAGAARIEVVARHALLGTEVRLSLPERAKFKHVKRALAAHLGVEDFVYRGKVIQKVDGVYRPFKDESRIGAARVVLIACPGLEAFGGDGHEAALCEADLSEEETLPEDNRQGSDSPGAEEEEDREPECTCGHELCDLCQRRPADAPTPSAPSRDRGAWLASRLSRGVGAGPTRLGPKGPCLTKRQALNLQLDLYRGFSESGFQEQLRRLGERHGELGGQAFAHERQELLLQVQAPVLLEYGFPGTRGGVVQMIGAMGPFVRDPEILQLGSDINRLIGVDLPTDAWRDVSRQCRDIGADVAAREAEAREARQRREGLVKERRRREERLLRGKLQPSLPAPVPIPHGWLGGDGVAHASLQPLQGFAGAQGQGIGAFLEALPFPRWQSPMPPLCVSVAGTWTNGQPSPMQWMAGLFLCPVTVGREGCERFQLLLGGRRDSVVYPSVADANHLDDYTICGPDGDDAGRAWQLGKGYPKSEDDAKPGARFALVAAIDHGAQIRLVGWQRY